MIKQNIIYIVINLAFFIYTVGLLNELKQNKVLVSIGALAAIPFLTLTLQYFIDIPVNQINTLIYIATPLAFATLLMNRKTPQMFLLAIPGFYLVFLVFNQIANLGFTDTVYLLLALPLGIGVYNYIKNNSDEAKLATIFTVILLRYFLIYLHGLT